MPKICATCNVEFTPKSKNERHKDCMDCVNAKRREKRRAERPDIVEHETLLQSGTMKCRSCNQVKSVDEFKAKCRTCKPCMYKKDVICVKANGLDSIIKNTQDKLKTEGLKIHKSVLYMKLLNLLKHEPEKIVKLFNIHFAKNKDAIVDLVTDIAKLEYKAPILPVVATSADAASAANHSETLEEEDIFDESVLFSPVKSKENEYNSIQSEDSETEFEDEEVSDVSLITDIVISNGDCIKITTHPLNIPAPKNRTKMSPEKEGVIKACRTRLRRIFKSKGLGKQKHTREYIGCDYDFLMKWIAFNLQEGMTLENRGAVWHIDHVIPISTFDIADDRNHVCFHWVNLTPLTATENLAKGNRTQYEQVCAHFDNLVKFLKQENMSLEPQYLELFARHLTNRGTP
jgi:hypothetical protein